LAQDYPDFEVIAVDNASTDGSADFIAENYPQVQIIRKERNLGFAGGCNTGLRAAHGEILVLLNQDTQVSSGWLGVLVNNLQKPEIGIVGCKALYPDGKTIQHAGGWIEWPLGLAHHYGRGEEDVGQWDDRRSVEYVTGAAMAFRHGVLDQIGFLDDRFWPGYFEDADFCFRARKAGYTVWYNPNAVVIHEESTSTESTMVSRAYQQGRLRFLLKHMSPRRFLEEFVPAEEKYQPPAIRGQESVALRLAYLKAIPEAVRILNRRWGASDEVIYQIIIALKQLHQQAWKEDWGKTKEQVPATVSRSPTSAEAEAFSSFPSLQEFEFRSSVPVVGPLIAQLRSLWYSVAARWAVRHLARQQEAINQQQEAINRKQEAINQQQEIYTQSLKQRVDVLAAENALLAKEIARIELRVELNEE
jgi:GT2 family glycosyltransferase